MVIFHFLQESSGFPLGNKLLYGYTRLATVARIGTDD